MDKYRNDTYEDKLFELIRSKDGNPAAVYLGTIFDRDSSIELNKLLNIMSKKGIDGKGHNEGFTVFIAAVAGSDGDDTEDSGEPIQFSAVAYKLNDDGSVEALPKSAIMNYNIKVSDKAFASAVTNKEKADIGAADGYDVFKDAGIDAAKYTADAKGYVHTAAEAVEKIEAFFSQFRPEYYPIISNGKGIGQTVTYSQQVFRKLSRSLAFESPLNVDFIQVVKEYCYRVYYDDKYEKNAIIDEDKLNSFSLEDIVRSDPEMVSALTNGQRTEEDMLASTKQKVFATAMLADEIRMQDREISERSRNEAFGDIPEFPSFSEMGSSSKDSNLDNNDLDFILGLKSIDDDISLPTLNEMKFDDPPYERKRDVVIVEGDKKKTAEPPSSFGFDLGSTDEDRYDRMFSDRRDRFESRQKSLDDGRPFYRRSGRSSRDNDEEVSRLLALIEDQQKLLSRKDAMISSANDNYLMLSQRLTEALERQTVLLEKLLELERQLKEK